MTITIDGDEVSEITIDGDAVSEVTIDGDTVWTAVDVIDDFEDGDHVGWEPYGAQTWTVSGTAPLEGAYSLVPDGDFYRINYQTDVCVRGNEYRALVNMAGFSGNQRTYWFTDPTLDDPLARGYVIFHDPPNNRIRTGVRDSTGTLTIYENTSVTLDASTTYQIGLQTTGTDIRGVIYDAGGTQLAASAWYADGEHTGGGIGCYTSVGGVKYDYFTDEGAV